MYQPCKQMKHETQVVHAYPYISQPKLLIIDSTILLQGTQNFSS